jgi:LPS O-antigen subunit length determinant protein (WzzB/FepE family)
MYQANIAAGGESMKKILIALPLLAILAVAGIAAAQPYWDAANLTQEQKNARLQMLDEMQDMINIQRQYLNGEITQEQFQEQLQEHHEEMQQFREENGGCPMMGAGMGGHGYGMHASWQE